MFPLALVLLLTPTSPGSDDKPAPPVDDQAALQGRWRVTKLELPEGVPDRDGLAKAAPGVELTVTGNRVTGRGPKEKEARTVVFRLDPTKSPRAIDLTVADEKGVAGKGEPTVLGIYRLDGDTAVIAATVLSPEPRRPKEFRPVASEKEAWIVVVAHLQRVK